jgi:hypothetical protein
MASKKAAPSIAGAAKISCLNVSYITYLNAQLPQYFVVLRHFVRLLGEQQGNGSDRRAFFPSFRLR